MSKVLVVATYPIKNTQHGGQKRLSAIVDAYREAGHTVVPLGVFDSGIYKDHSRYDIELSPEATRVARSHPWTSDILCGNAVYYDPEVKRQMIARLRSIKPDVLHFEQPFMYLGLKPLLKELNLRPKIIFGSQNIEGPMKREILEGQFVPQDDVEKAVATIENIENELAHDADIVIACTKSDADVYIKAGVSEAKIIIAHNGIHPAITSEADILYWQQVFDEEDIRNKILFIASAHPPSITGFEDMIGKGLGFLGAHDRIMVAGSVSDYFQDIFKDTNLDIGDSTMWLRMYPCGRLSESRLGSLISLADVIVLPITEGGGSNLKTAEALLSNKKIVTTSHALRSFEWAKDLPNVWVADDDDAFRAAIMDALVADFVPRSPEQQAQVDKVTWENQLIDFREKMRSL